MSVTIPIASFFASEFRHSGVGNIQRLEKFIKMFGVRKIQDQFLKGVSILKCIFNGLIKSFNFEKFLKVLKICHKEVEKILCIIPFAEKQGKFICFFIR